MGPEWEGGARGLSGDCALRPVERPLAPSRADPPAGCVSLESSAPNIQTVGADCLGVV